jgi:thymidylate synthase
LRTADIRAALIESYQENPFRPMIEIKAASFIADAPAIIGEPNQEYIRNELDWYESQSLSINDIPGGVPLMWRRTASEDGRVNSNYGWVFWSAENGDQFANVVRELRRDYASRRALAIYTRPSMHLDQKLGGTGQDFMCTNAVAYSIDPVLQRLDVTVQMRSNDVVFGYRNDYAWQVYAAEYVIADLRRDWPFLELGTIYWQAMSLHVYPRHYGLLRAAVKGSKRDRVRDGDVA